MVGATFGCFDEVDIDATQLVRSANKEVWMRLSIGDKAQRVLVVLMAIRNPKVFKILEAHGFTKAELDQGWRLLRAVSDVKLKAVDSAPALDPLELRRLDDWENKWFVIIQATLARHYPKLRDAVFANLSQTQGPDLVLSVGTLLKRLKEMERDAEGKAARKLLETRGVTKVVLADGQEMVDKLSTIAVVPDEGPEDDEALDAAEAEAVDALWAWYLEWSEIARSAIQSRSLLRKMGFLQARKSDGKDEESDTPAGMTPVSNDAHRASCSVVFRSIIHIY